MQSGFKKSSSQRGTSEYNKESISLYSFPNLYAEEAKGKEGEEVQEEEVVQEKEEVVLYLQHGKRLEWGVFR